MAADNFTQIANALFRDRRISFKAKGIFGLISTHRDGWRVTVAELVRSGTDGKAAVSAGLKELEKFGYLVRDRERRPDGTLGDAVYSITDMPAHLFDLYGDDAPALPIKRQTRRSEPKSENPALENPAQANRTTKNTTSQNTTGQKTKPRPSVRDAKAPASEPEPVHGRTADLPPEESRPQQPEPPAAPAVAPTEGVLLLTAIGNERPEFRLTGKPLAHQGLAVDGLLASGWAPEQIRGVVAGRTLPEKTRSVGAVISRRLRDAAASPPPSATPTLPRQRVHDDAPAYGSPASGPTPTPPRYTAGDETPHAKAECPGDGGMCKTPSVLAETGLCPLCSGWTRCDCGRWHSGVGERCRRCAAEYAEAEAALRKAVGDEAYEQAFDTAPLIFSEATESERLIGLSGEGAL